MVETWEGTDRLTFQYDYMGRRVEKKVYDGQTLTTHLKFVYDGFKLVEELDALNGDTPLRRYTWQPFEAGLDVVLQMMDVPGNAYSFHLHDANKNVMEITNDIGVTDVYASYSPFGNITNNQLTIAHESLFFDSELTLLLLHDQYFSPKIGLFFRQHNVSDGMVTPDIILLIYGFVTNLSANKTVRNASELGKAKCNNITGEMEIEPGLIEHPGTNCVQQHEQQHVENGKACCKNYARCLQKARRRNDYSGAGKCYKKYKDWHDNKQQKQWDECSAHAAEKNCLEKKIGDCPRDPEVNYENLEEEVEKLKLYLKNKGCSSELSAQECPL